MAGISLILQNNPTVRQINCGTSSPKLGGTISLSAFPDLQDFRCNNNDITAINGYEQNSNLGNIQFFNNKVTGSLPSLSGMSALYWFSCATNQLTGSIPSLSALTNLETFICNSNQLTGSIPSFSGLNSLKMFECYSNALQGTIPSLSGLSNLEAFRCHSNQLTGSIPSLSGLSNLQNFQCQNQGGDTKLTGPIPSLSGLSNLQIFNCGKNQLTGSIPSLSGLNNLEFFGCWSNQLTGPIPSLSGLSNLETFACYSNQLTNFAGGSVSNTLINFQAQNNQLPQSAVDAILAEFVAAGGISGTLLLAGSNASPNGGTGNSDKIILEGRGWDVAVTP
jgi:Leucine-rich repeat (LRR) protein